MRPTPLPNRTRSHVNDSVAKSDWFSTVTVDDTAAAAAAFMKVEQLLTGLQPTSIDRSRSTANFTNGDVQINLHHTSGIAMLAIDLHYDSDGGGMFNVMGFEEYYQLRGEPPVEQDALDDLIAVLVNDYTVDDTYWRGRKIRTVVTQIEPGERSTGSSYSGWLLPARWFIPHRKLTTHSHRYSYGGQRPAEPAGVPD